MTPAPTRTLGTIWWFVMGALGFHFPYYAYYLKENAGLTGAEVGMVLAVILSLIHI